MSMTHMHTIDVDAFRFSSSFPTSIRLQPVTARPSSPIRACFFTYLHAGIHRWYPIRVVGLHGRCVHLQVGQGLPTPVRGRVRIPVGW